VVPPPPQQAALVSTGAKNIADNASTTIVARMEMAIMLTLT
jgi:hypothetical protein